MSEKYKPSEEEIKKGEEAMTEEQKERSKEREETINAAGGKIENVALKTKIEQLERVIENQTVELYGEEAYEIAIESKYDKVRIGIGIGILEIDNKNYFRLENPRTHEKYSIPIELIECIKLAGKASWDKSEEETLLWQNKN